MLDSVCGWHVPRRQTHPIRHLLEHDNNIGKKPNQPDNAVSLFFYERTVVFIKSNERASGGASNNQRHFLLDYIAAHK
jgi:hypothetical protein